MMAAASERLRPDAPDVLSHVDAAEPELAGAAERLDAGSACAHPTPARAARVRSGRSRARPRRSRRARRSRWASGSSSSGAPWCSTARRLWRRRGECDPPAILGSVCTLAGLERRHCQCAHHTRTSIYSSGSPSNLGKPHRSPGVHPLETLRDYDRREREPARPAHPRTPMPTPRRATALAVSATAACALVLTPLVRRFRGHRRRPDHLLRRRRRARPDADRHVRDRHLRRVRRRDRHRVPGPPVRRERARRVGRRCSTTPTPTAITEEFALSSDGVANSVAVRPDGLGVIAFEAAEKTDPGHLVFFDANAQDDGIRRTSAKSPSARFPTW